MTINRKSTCQSFLSFCLSGSLALASVSILVQLSGCGGPKEQKETETTPQDTAFEKDFLEGKPDVKAVFPEAEFAKAKELRTKKLPDSAAKLLLSKLDDAKASARGTTELGKYLVRLNNVLFDSGRDDESIKYGEVASKLFYAQPLEKRPLPAWFVNIHSYLAQAYDRKRNYAAAERQYLKAIQMTGNATKAEVSDAWTKLLYDRLAFCYESEGKKDKAEQVRKEKKAKGL